MRVAFVVVCLIGAVSVLLLLNGQTFTNALVSLALVSAAICVSAASALDRAAGKAKAQRWRMATLLMAIVVAYILASLPHAYRFQKRFNREVERIRALNPNVAKPGS
jgi:uncharacterized PurR-regulated membrane protein YhhQ (DUF165 family)